MDASTAPSSLVALPDRALDTPPPAWLNRSPGGVIGDMVSGAAALER